MRWGAAPSVLTLVPRHWATGQYYIHSTSRGTTVLPGIIQYYPGVLYYPGYYCNTRGTTALSLWRYVYAIVDYRAAISSTRGP